VIKYSIIIPTYKNFDLLKSCLESIVQYTDLSNIEIIIVANGCGDDETKNYVTSLGNPFKLLWFDDAIGYTKACNEGIKLSQGEYIILLNNDVILLSQEKSTWIQMLEAPFIQNNKTGITGPGKFWWYTRNIQWPIIAFWCAMFKREMIEKTGFLDEIFSPGNGEDIDFCIQLTKLGKEIVGVPLNPSNEIERGDPYKTFFPIYHVGSATFSQDNTKTVALIERAKIILNERYAPRVSEKAFVEVDKDPEISIIIPTYNHCADLLNPCIESLIKYTDLNKVEILISANGCTDETKEYINKLGSPFRLIWTDEAIGFPKAINKAASCAKGKYLVLLNNDTVLLPQEKHDWINMLKAPFANDPLVGITGPLELYDHYAGSPVLIFFCVMISKKIFDEFQGLDEIYSPGGGEDIDLTMKCLAKGYKTVQVPNKNVKVKNMTNEGFFPICHVGEGTFNDNQHDYYRTIAVKKNGLRNAIRYNKHIKLNLGSAGIEFPGYLSVDKNDQRASIIADIFDLDFPENSVEEILASHLFEHISPYKSLDLLQRWFKILKPGGKLIMEMPNIEEFCKMFVTADKAARYQILTCIYGSVNTTDAGNKEEITSPHLWGWYPEIMYDHLAAAGFINIVFMPEQIPHPISPQTNFRVEAKKPGKYL
jgi:GT2 family glycosyltransferase